MGDRVDLAPEAGCRGVHQVQDAHGQLGVRGDGANDRRRVGLVRGQDADEGQALGLAHREVARRGRLAALEHRALQQVDTELEGAGDGLGRVGALADDADAGVVRAAHELGDVQRCGRGRS